MEHFQYLIAPYEKGGRFYQDKQQKQGAQLQHQNDWYQGAQHQDAQYQGSQQQDAQHQDAQHQDAQYQGSQQQDCQQRNHNHQNFQQQHDHHNQSLCRQQQWDQSYRQQIRQQRQELQRRQQQHHQQLNQSHNKSPQQQEQCQTPHTPLASGYQATSHEQIARSDHQTPTARSSGCEAGLVPAAFGHSHATQTPSSTAVNRNKTRTPTSPGNMNRDLGRRSSGKKINHTRAQAQHGPVKIPPVLRPKPALCFWWYHFGDCRNNPDDAKFDPLSGEAMCQMLHYLDAGMEKVEMEDVTRSRHTKVLNGVDCGLDRCKHSKNYLPAAGMHAPAHLNLVAAAGASAVKGGQTMTPASTAPASPATKNRSYNKNQNKNKNNNNSKKNHSSPSKKRKAPNSPQQQPTPSKRQKKRQRLNRTTPDTPPAPQVFEVIQDLDGENLSNAVPIGGNTNKKRETCFLWYHGVCDKRGPKCGKLHALTNPIMFVQPPRGFVHSGECLRAWCPGDWLWEHDEEGEMERVLGGSWVEDEVMEGNAGDEDAEGDEDGKVDREWGEWDG